MIRNFTETVRDRVYR